MQTSAAAAMPSGIAHPTLASSFRVVSAEGLDAAPLLASDRSDDNVLAILCRTTDIRKRAREILGRLAGLDRNATGVGSQGLIQGHSFFGYPALGGIAGILAFCTGAILSVLSRRFTELEGKVDMATQPARFDVGGWRGPERRRGLS